MPSFEDLQLVQAREYVLALMDKGLPVILGLGRELRWRLQAPLRRGMVERTFKEVEGRRHSLTAADLNVILEVSRYAPIGREIARIKRKLSMLHTDVLILLYYFASIIDGGILEIGPYVGGSTITMCKALQRSRRRVPFVCVEMGGSHPHNMIPSTDIVGDLRKNLERYSVSHLTRVLVGYANEERIVAELKKIFEQERIGLWLIDADGEVGRDFKNYLSHCKPGCFVVIDDYVSDYVPEKTNITQPTIDRMVEAGKLRTIGVYGWGTWVGQVV